MNIQPRSYCDVLLFILEKFATRLSVPSEPIKELTSQIRFFPPKCQPTKQCSFSNAD